MTLADDIRRSGQIPDDAHGDPWFEDGNILLVSDTAVFRYPRSILMRQAPIIAEMLNLENLSDDYVDLIDFCPMFEFHDTAKDLSSFLLALHDESEMPVSVESLEDFQFLSGVLRLSTKYDVSKLRQQALWTLEERYPSTLPAWDKLHHRDDSSKPWKPHTALIFKLAMEMNIYSMLPAAMAELANDISCTDVFTVALDHKDLPHHKKQEMILGNLELDQLAEQGLRALQELNYRSILRALKFIRSIGAECDRPPEVVPSSSAPSSKAPVGTRVVMRKPQPSACHREFQEIVRDLLEALVLDKPMGYDDFMNLVFTVIRDEGRTCRKCWDGFVRGRERMRDEWWDAVPRKLGFKGWEDAKLVRARSEVEASSW